jgi:uncharacterized OB-fold protein
MSASAAVVAKRPAKRGRRRSAPAATSAGSPSPVTGPPTERLPYLLDLYPQESSARTRLSPFFDALKEGRFTTTRCRKDRRLLWPPRIVCPQCHLGELDWVDLPTTGRIYAFSALLAGAPVGQEKDLPRVVGLVELEGAPLRLFGRLLGIDWPDCRIGMRVQFEAFGLPDGRAYYAFRVRR